MKELNNSTLEWWLQQFEKGKLTDQQVEKLMQFIELDEVMHDASLKINAEVADEVNKVSFTHLPAKAKEDIELLAFDIAEGNLSNAEQYWVPQLFEAFAGLEALVKDYEKVTLQANNKLTLPNKALLKKEAKVVVFNKYSIGAAASIILALGITFFYQPQQSIYELRKRTIQVTAFKEEPLQIFEEVKAPAKEEEPNHIARTHVSVTDKPVQAIMEKLVTVEQQIIPSAPSSLPAMEIADVKVVDKSYQENKSALAPKIEQVQDDLQLAISAGKENTAEAYQQAKTLVNNVGDVIKKAPDKWRLKQTKRIKILGTNFVFEPMASNE
jgi:hypothetical protein